jgi:uncharacterized membrane protein
MKSRKIACPIYLGLISLFGLAVVVTSACRIVIDRVSYQWLVLAYLTILTGAFTIKIPGVNSKLSVADTFVFINMILFGSAAGALTAALDGCLASIRFETPQRRRRATPFNTAVMAISAFAAGEIFFRQFGRKPLSLEPSPGILELVVPIILSAFIYYLCNSALVAGIVALDSGASVMRIWLDGFARISLVYWAGPAVGLPIAYGIRSITPLTLLFIVPMLVMLYALDKISVGPELEAPVAADNDPVARRPAYRRFHYLMVTLGLGFIILLLVDVLKDRISSEWLILAALTVCAGFITVRIPGIKIKLTLADTFVFANTILFGPVVGGITAAIDGLAGSVRCKSGSRRMEFALFNMAAMALSAYLAGEVFFRMLGRAPLYQAAKLEFGPIILPALTLAISYYFLNALSVSFIVALQAEVNALQIWRDNLLWGIATYITCALGAVLISAGILAVHPGFAIGILLLLAAVYATYRALGQKPPPGLRMLA